MPFPRGFDIALSTFGQNLLTRAKAATCNKQMRSSGRLQEDKEAQLSAWDAGLKSGKEPRPASGVVDIAGSPFLIPFGGIFLTRILTLRCATLQGKEK